MSSQNVTNRTQNIIYILVIFGFIAVINYLGTQKFFRFDLTENKIFSISKPTREILRELDDIVNVKVYFSKNLPAHLKKTESDVRDLLSEYSAYAGKNLRITWEDPAADEESKQRVRSLGIPEIRMQTIEQDKAQVIQGFLGIAVLYGDNKEVLPVIQDVQNFEYDLTQAIMKVVRTEVPKIAVLRTDTSAFIPPQIRQQMGMPAADGTEERYRPIFQQLRENYDVSLVDISDGTEIDSSYRTLIIPGGVDFSQRDLFEIDQYLMKGGNVIALVDAIEVSFQNGPNAQPKSPQLISLLEHYGARVENNIVLDASCGQVQIPQNFGGFQMNVPIPYPYFVLVSNEGFDRKNPAVSALGELVLPWSSPITLLKDDADSSALTEQGYKVKGHNAYAAIMASSSERSWVQSGTFNLDPNQQWNPPADGFVRSPLMAHLHGSFTSYFAEQSAPPPLNDMQQDTLNQIQLNPADQGRTIVKSTPESHLVIVGDSDFLTAQNAAPANVAWIVNVVDWLSLDKNLIAVRSRTIEDRTITKDQLSKKSHAPNIIRAINVALMPLVLIIIGLVIYYNRRESVTMAVASKETKKND